MLADPLRSLGELLGCLELALGGDDLRPPLALRLSLPRHRPLHRLRDLHVLDLDGRHLYAPRLGLLVDDPLELVVQPLPLREQRVQLCAAEHRSQRRLGDLRGGEQEVLDLHDRVVRVDHPEVADRVHGRRHVVPGDHLLRRNAECDRAQVDPHHLVDDRDQEDQARAFLSYQSPQAKDDATLVLTQHPDRAGEQDDAEEDEDPDYGEKSGHG